MVKAGADPETLPVGAPVEADHGLGADDAGVEELDGAWDSARRLVLLVLPDPGHGVVVLVEVKASVATPGHKNVPVLRPESDSNTRSEK